MMLRKRMRLCGVLLVLYKGKGVAQIVHLFSTMRRHGLGLDVGAVGAHDSLLFRKTLWCDLSESAAKFLEDAADGFGFGEVVTLPPQTQTPQIFLKNDAAFFLVQAKFVIIGY